MEISKISQLKPYSLGVVVKDKPDGSDQVEVWPVEEFSMENGKILKQLRKFKSDLPDINNVVKSAKADGEPWLTAKWIPYGNDNRDTAPDLIKNETIMIYRYADTQEYYWTTLFREPEFRRLEHVRYAYSNKPSGVDAFDSDSSYFVEFSTKRKFIRLITSSNDGEPCKYNIRLDTGVGTLTVEDDLGNSIFLDSPAGKLEIVTNTSIAFKTGTFHVEADDIRLNGATKIKDLTTEVPTKTVIIPQMAKVPPYTFVK